ncbi:meiotic recombination protein REC8 homolog [Pollicipes pollicipes]|uniref:meiotic recombination protein REC8 homolog n=1 Tax=Pollicipes pollicipes TaxID=41117 RepID=UPI001884F324|nr:meiotic recombination protein REC8 homolog [Pollicipes pollicipes]
MFFDYSLLNRRNGKFSLIWLIANDRLEYRRRTDKNFRDVMSLDVPQVCEDILRYICVRIPACGGDQARPRLSLYLSSMLMAGSVRVHRHQTGVLLFDVAAAFEKLMKTPYTGSLENEPASYRKVTLAVDPLELVPPGDPFQLGSLYDIGTMPNIPTAAAEQEDEPASHHRPELNGNVAVPSEITLREEQRPAGPPPFLEDFGDVLPPHQRPLQQPFADPLLELELDTDAVPRYS